MHPLALALDAVAVSLIAFGMLRGQHLGFTNALLRVVLIAMSALVASAGAYVVAQYLEIPLVMADVVPVAGEVGGSSEEVIDELRMFVTMQDYMARTEAIARTFLVPIASAVALFLIAYLPLRWLLTLLTGDALHTTANGVASRLGGALVGFLAGNVWLVMLTALAPLAPEQWYKFIYVKAKVMSYYANLTPRGIDAIWEILTH